LAITNRAVLSVYRPLLDRLGLTHPQYLVILALWDHHRADRDQPPLSVKQIAAALQLDSATLSPMLKRVETLGLITRTRSAADERAKAGIALRRRALKVRRPSSHSWGSAPTNSSNYTRYSPASTPRRWPPGIQ
jgi:MarR family transcriptional regulator, organic hydroperoxide resistance regulator